MSIETKVKEVFKDVLDIEPDEIAVDEKLDESIGIDSTEMVEITVALKKAFNLDMATSELKKSQTFTEIVAALKARGAKD